MPNGKGLDIVFPPLQDRIRRTGEISEIEKSSARAVMIGWNRFMQPGS
jgi:hypothetical protein